MLNIFLVFACAPLLCQTSQICSKMANFLLSVYFGGHFCYHSNGYTVQIANEFPIFAGLMRDSCESNACEINAYSFANTRIFREVLHMNQSERRGPRTG